MKDCQKYVHENADTVLKGAVSWLYAYPCSICGYHKLKEPCVQQLRSKDCPAAREIMAMARTKLDEIKRRAEDDAGNSEKG